MLECWLSSTLCLQLQMQVKQQRIDDLTKTVRQFRELRQGEEEVWTNIVAA